MDRSGWKETVRWNWSESNDDGDAVSGIRVVRFMVPAHSD